MNNRKVLIVGAYGTGNLGDDAIMVGLLKDLQNRGCINTCDDVIVFSRDPKETSLIHNVNAKRRNLFDLLISTEVIIGGGELFQDLGKMALKYSILGLVSRILGKHVVFYAIGVSTIRNSFGRAITRLSMNASNGIFVRDHMSKIRLEKLGVHKPIYLIRDPSLNSDPIPLEAASRLLELEGIKISNYKIIVGVTTQYIRDRRLNDQVQKLFLCSLRSILQDYSSLCVIFFPFTRSKDNPKNIDAIYGTKLRKQLNIDRFKMLQHNYMPQEIMGIFGLVDVVISTRLHPLIFALKMNVPGIGVVVFEKVSSFCREHGFPVVKAEEAEKLRNLTEKLIKQKLEKRVSSTIITGSQMRPP